jgi:hypothetical protein
MRQELFPTIERKQESSDPSMECRTSIPRTLGWAGLAVLTTPARHRKGIFPDLVKRTCE